MSQERYARHSLIPNWKQERLAEAKVAVVGCGALGNEVLKNLALLGVGNIWVIDYDTIEIHNLTRSVLFRELDIGRYKAEVVTQRLKELNSDIHIHPVIGKFETDFGRGLLSEMDVVVGCLDSIEARYLLNKRCYSVGVPWIDGGINHYSGNVAFFEPRMPETACYQCKMDTSAWKRFNEKYSCGNLKDNYEEPKLATTIMTASIVAAYQVEVLIQLLLGKVFLNFWCKWYSAILGDQRNQENKLHWWFVSLIWHCIVGKAHRATYLKPGTQLILPVSQPSGFRIIEFSPNDKCSAHGAIPHLSTDNYHVELPKFNLAYTPSQVADKLGLDKDWKLELPFDFVARVTCSVCGYSELIGTPRNQVKQSKTICPKCNGVKDGEIMYREIPHYCHLDHNHEDAKKPFSFFKLCHREIVQYIYLNKRMSIELTEDFFVNTPKEC